MKLIAQSVVPSKPTYLHLAYIAASSKHDSYVIGPLVIFIAILIALYQRQSKPKLWKPLLTLGIGVVVAASMYLQPVTYRHPQAMSHHRAERLFRAISYHHEQGEPMPSSVQEMRKKWKLEKEDIQDVWNRDLRVVDYHQDKEVPYRVVSAGMDGRFSTDDDISYPTLDGKSYGLE